jgi:hypothetical protein
MIYFFDYHPDYDRSTLWVAKIQKIEFFGCLATQSRMRFGIWLIGNYLLFSTFLG